MTPHPTHRFHAAGVYSTLLSVVGLSCGLGEPTPDASGPFRPSLGELSAIVRGADGEPAEFGRVVGGAILANGNLAVADGMGQVITFFSDDGDMIRTVGRSGEGPGEFTGLFGLDPYLGDSLVAFDRRLGRVTVLDSAGTLGRVVNMPREGEARFEALGPFGSSGDFVGAFYKPSEQDAGLRHDSAAYRRLDAGLRDIGPIAVSAGRDILAQGRRGAPGGGSRLTFTVPAFAKWLAYGAGSAGLVVPGKKSYELILFRPGGEEVSVRWNGRDLTITNSDQEAYLESLLRQVPADLGEITATQFRQLEKPAKLPFYSRIHLDRAGRPWVADYVPYWDRPRVWTVFSQDGRLLTRFVLERPMELLDVTMSHALVVEVDALGVEVAQVWRHGIP